MRWVPAVVAMVCCVAQAEAQITLADLNLQTQKTLAAQQAHMLAVNEFSVLTQNVTIAQWMYQHMREYAVLYYEAGDYTRGDAYAAAMTLWQWERDRLLALVPAKQAEVENKHQAYLREYARLNAMFDAYDRQ